MMCPQDIRVHRQNIAVKPTFNLIPALLFCLYFAGCRPGNHQATEWKKKFASYENQQNRFELRDYAALILFSFCCALPTNAKKISVSQIMRFAEFMVCSIKYNL